MLCVVYVIKALIYYLLDIVRSAYIQRRSAIYSNVARTRGSHA